MKPVTLAATVALGALVSALAAAAPVLTPIPAGIPAPPAAPPQATTHPALWPQTKSQGLIDPATEARITALMATMSLREKVGQMVQGDITHMRPEDLRRYPLGSILGGGNSPPLDADERAPVAAWRRTADLFRAVSVEARPGHVPIPVIFGMDSVHGNSNVTGAVIFPHNIGLGAAHDPDLVRRVAEVAGAESAAAGFDWAFAPTVTVPQDDRWGRSYEGFSERPEIVSAYAAKVVEGLQGKPGEGTVQTGHAAASIKHFLADGGTKGGVDQGDAEVSEADLIKIHAAGYYSAIPAGAMTVMVSFSSWNGTKNTGNRSLITDVLKGRMGFEGFVVGDWNAHGQVPGCSTADCPAAINAGLDMIMVPDDWRALFDNTVAEVKSGVIPMARIDDAVRRILRVKYRMGLFDPARPYERRDDVLGTPAHRAVARDAVAESLVLLKNNGGLLPIKPGQHVLVTGTHADEIGMASGGWTLSWQGNDNTNAMFPNGRTIWSGLKEAIETAGGTATLSKDGAVAGAKPDVAIVVFGEQPYAEMVGDIATLEFQPGDKQALAELKALKAKGIPTVSVFISGRPLWVNPELNQSDAFVAAFLPGSEGEGVADVLVAGKDGTPNRDFRGKLSFSWPKTAGQFTLNAGQPGYDPLFAYGYGLTYADHKVLGPLAEVSGVDASKSNTSVYFVPGKAPPPWKFVTQGAVTVRNVDAAGKQEGGRQFAFTGPGEVRSEGSQVNLVRQANGDLSLKIDYRVDKAPEGKVSVGLNNAAGSVDATSVFKGAVGEARSVKIKLSCFGAAGADLTQVSAPFRLASDKPFTITISGLHLDGAPAGSICPGAK